MNQEGILTDFSIDYENGSSNSYMVITNKNNIIYKNYQVEMVTSNSIAGILSMDFRQKNNITGLYYNITSKVTLSQYVAHRRLNKAEFIKLLSNVVKTLLDCRKYLLSCNSFVLNEDYIFLNPSTQETSLMYLPIEQSCSIEEQLRKLVVSIIVEKANFDDSSNDNFLQRILEFVRNDNLTVQSFYTFLVGLNNSKTQGCKVEVKHDEEQSTPNTMPDLKNEKKKSIKSKPLDEHVSIPIKNRVIKKSDIKAAENSATEGQSKPIILLVLAQALVVILFFIGKGYLLNLTDDPVSAYGGTGITLLALDFLAMRKIFDKKESKGKALNIEKRAIISDVKIPDVREKILRPAQEKKMLDDDISELNILSNLTENQGTSCYTQTNPSNHSQLCLDETTVLCEREPDNPYLSYRHDGVEERINISKDSFIIGRLQGHADYICTNNAVGKIHAEIVKKMNLYFLKDLNSRNGSFINGEQIIPNMENQIKSGDRLSFANSDFTFFAPENSNG